MGFLDVDQEKLNLFVVVVVKFGKPTGFPAKGRSGVAPKDERDRFVSLEAGELDLPAVLGSAILGGVGQLKIWSIRSFLRNSTARTRPTVSSWPATATTTPPTSITPTEEIRLVELPVFIAIKLRKLLPTAGVLLLGNFPIPILVVLFGKDLPHVLTPTASTAGRAPATTTFRGLPIAPSHATEHLVDALLLLFVEKPIAILIHAIKAPLHAFRRFLEIHFPVTILIDLRPRRRSNASPSGAGTPSGTRTSSTPLICPQLLLRDGPILIAIQFA